MRNIILTFVFLFFASFGFSQGFHCVVKNSINSGSVQVVVVASPPGNCNITCQSAPYCVYPGQTIKIPPCGPDFWEWSLAVVIPTTDDCQVACPFTSFTFVSPNGCAAPIASAFHCHAGPYTSDFISGGANTLLIY